MCVVSWTFGSWLFIVTYWIVNNWSSVETWLQSFLRWANLQADPNNNSGILAFSHETYVRWSCLIYLIWNICWIVFTVAKDQITEYPRSSYFSSQKCLLACSFKPPTFGSVARHSTNSAKLNSYELTIYWTKLGKQHKKCQIKFLSNKIEASWLLIWMGYEQLR
jgi:hypothetical protein